MNGRVAISYWSGAALEDVLGGIARTQTFETTTVPLAESRAVYDQMTRTGDLILAEPDRRIVGELLSRGQADQAFRVMAAFAPRVRQEYARYLGEMALQSYRLTREEAAARPWRDQTVPPSLEPFLEPYRSLAQQKINFEDLEVTTQKLPFAQHDERREEIGGTIALAYERYANHDAKAAPNAPWAQRLAKAVVAEAIGAPAGYWIWGGGLDSKNVDGRIYLSLRKEEALNAIRYLTKEVARPLAARGINLQYKTSAEEEGYGRFDSGVIYFSAKDEKPLYGALVRMHRAHPEFFKPGHPVFTLPVRGPDGAVLQGLSFGQDPGAHSSFGSVRAAIMTSAIRIGRLLAQEGHKMDWSEMRRVFAYCLEKRGIDPVHPAFETGGRDLFPLFGKMAAQRALQSVPLSPGAPAKPPSNDVTWTPAEWSEMLVEIMRRFPIFNMERWRRLRERLAQAALEKALKEGKTHGDAAEEAYAQAMAEPVRAGARKRLVQYFPFLGRGGADEETALWALTESLAESWNGVSIDDLDNLLVKAVRNFLQILRQRQNESGVRPLLDQFNAVLQPKR